MATVISFCALSFGSTGSGDFARRSASVLPPPSRFACASTSALVGFSFVFALTSATSSGEPRPRSLMTTGAKWIDRITACNATEIPTAQREQACRCAGRPVLPRGIRAGGSAPAGASFAVRGRLGGGGAGLRLLGNSDRGIVRNGDGGLAHAPDRHDLDDLSGDRRVGLGLGGASWHERGKRDRPAILARACRCHWLPIREIPADFAA